MLGGWVKEIRDYTAAVIAGTSSLKVSLDAAPTITIGEVDQGSKGDAATDAWYVQLVTNAGVALLGRLAAAASIPVVLSTEDAATATSLDGKIAAAAAASDTNTNPTTAAIRAALQFFDGTQWVRARGGMLSGISAANLALMLNALATGRYNASDIALTDGLGAALQLTSTGQLRVVVEPTLDTTGGWSMFNDPGPASADLVVKVGAGKIGTITCSSVAGSTVWYQLHDKGSALATNDKPIYEQNVASGGTFRQELTGLKFTGGLRVGLSSTQRVYTASVATLASMIVTLTYK